MQTNDITEIVRRAVQAFEASQTGREIDGDDYLEPIAEAIRTWVWNRKHVADVRTAILSLPYGADTDLLTRAFPEIVRNFQQSVPVEYRDLAQYLDGDQLNRMLILAVDASNRALVSTMCSDEADSYQLDVMSFDEAVYELAGYLRGGNFGSELDDPEVLLHLDAEAGVEADVDGTKEEWEALSDEEKAKEWETFHDLNARGTADEMHFYRILMNAFLVDYVGH
ncbi:hypothetical protein [Pseudoduganella sp. R-34]|uniref:hypothetical protein n=1 Tax=Pseudoduganella sp. R-34 TaxID=3404062 RepID=UPI003CF9CA82